MNLQEILNYRNNCIVCNREMVLNSQDLLRIKITTSENGLFIKTGHKDIGVHFKNDGTFQKNTKFSKLMLEPLTLVKECPTCRRGKGTNAIILKGRSAGLSTMAKSTYDSLNSLINYYTLEIFGDSEGNFDCHIDEECIKYYDGKSFWHMATKHQEGLTKLTHGILFDKLGDNMDKSFYLDLPVWNTSKLRDINHYVNKYKTIITFS